MKKWKITIKNYGLLDSKQMNTVQKMIPSYCNTSGNETFFEIHAFKTKREANVFLRSVYAFLNYIDFDTMPRDCHGFILLFDINISKD